MNALFGNSVQEYYLEIVRRIHAARRARIDALRTRNDAECYIADIRAKIHDCFVFPKEKCALDPEVTGKLEFPGFSMEKVIYHSRPDFPVTANFYLPEQAKRGKVPAVLFVCGHSPAGKAEDFYQKAPRGLASRGFAVLAIDPAGQGERLQFSDVPGFPEGNPCVEHNIIGKQCALAGEWFGAWRTWDAIRGIDYLLSRPEVDPTRLGVHGTSGGGTLSTWIAGVEDRITMAAPSCYITTWEHNVENELPADIEQMPPRALAAGLEMADFLIAAAPRPVILLGEKNDFFDPRGLEEAVGELRKIHSLLGVKEDSVKLYIGPGSHSLSIFLRQAMYEFFCSQCGIRGMPYEEGELPLSTFSDIAAAPGGQVKNIPGQKYIRDFIRGKAEVLASARQKHTLRETREILTKLLNFGSVKTPHVRVCRPIGISDTQLLFSRFALETEPGRVMSVLKLYDRSDWYHVPDVWKEAVLYIPNLDSADELRLRMPEKDTALYGLDVRGVGELTPLNGDQGESRFFFEPYQFDYHYAALGFMLGSPYLGGKVKDILCAVELLSEHAKTIRLEAAGQGCVPALLAAVLSDRIESLKLADCPESWIGMVRDPYPNLNPMSYMVPGILEFTDLPDLKELIRDKIL